MGDTDLKAEMFRQLARVGKGIANGKRLELLDLLAQTERTVDALAAESGLNLTTASAHLQTLKQAGLVSTRRAGTRIFYRLSGSDVADLLVRACQVASRHLPDVQAIRGAYLGASHDITSLDRDELAKRMTVDDLTLLDVRPEPEYSAAHLPGAINIPVDQLDQRIAEIPHGPDVIAYCRGPNCAFAHAAVAMLQRHGHRAARLTDGVTEWRLAGLPVSAGR